LRPPSAPAAAVAAGVLQPLLLYICIVLQVAGTEMGVTEPEATFSACYGGAFLMWHPMKYAAMLADKMRQRGTKGWLVNTGWTGGSYGVGSRISLKYTRAIIDAIHSGALDSVEYVEMPLFKLQVGLGFEGLASDGGSPGLVTG
jgi:phosphoenolpyruvate carboxykinase (ATP)